MEHELNILMILGMKNPEFWTKQCIVGYCYKYTRVTYDWFVVQGHIFYHGAGNTSSRSGCAYFNLFATTNNFGTMLGHWCPI